MTDDDLVRRLLVGACAQNDVAWSLMRAAADRIKALTAEHNATLARLAGAVAREIALTAERDRLRYERDAILLDGTVHSDQREKYERLCARIAAGKASQQDAVEAIRQLCRDNERLALRRSDARAEAAENERMRKELEDIANDYEAGYPLSHDVIKYVARAALKGESLE